MIVVLNAMCRFVQQTNKQTNKQTKQKDKEKSEMETGERCGIGRGEPLAATLTGSQGILSKLYNPQSTRPYCDTDTHMVIGEVTPGFLRTPVM